jgi:hypothetical protein
MASTLENKNEIWNRLGNDSQVLNSEKGPNFAWTRPGIYKQYTPVKFNGGVNIPADTLGQDRVFCSQGGINLNNFLYDIWFKQKDTVNNGGNGLGVTSRRGFFVFFIDGNNFFALTILNSNTSVTIRVGGTYYGYGITTGFSWAANSLNHMLLGYKQSGIDGGSTVIKVRLNSIDVFSSTTVFPALGSGASMNFGCSVNFPGGPSVYQYGFYGGQDNVKMYKELTGSLFQEADDNKNREGFPTTIIIPVKLNLNRERVLFLDDFTDINKLGHVEQLQSVDENKTFQKDKLIINEINQEVLNIDNFYTFDNIRSAISGTSWKYKPFKRIDKNNELIWNGIITDISQNHNNYRATIVSSDILSQFQEEKIEYESEDWEPPSQAALNILRALNYPEENINIESFETSNNIYDNNNALIKVNFNKSDNISLQSALDKLGTFGAADVYMEQNRINFVVWRPFSGGIKTDLKAADFIEAPVVDSPNENLINEYVISYANDNEIPAKDSTGDNIGRLSRLPTRNGLRDFVLNGSLGQQIIIKDKITADYIGQTYIKRTHKDLFTNPRALTRIRHSISINNANWLDLNTWNTITYKRAGWDGKIFELFGLRKDSSSKKIAITEFEIAS